MTNTTPAKLIRTGWLAILVNLTVVIVVVFGVRFAEVKKVPIRLRYISNHQFECTTAAPVKNPEPARNIRAVLYYGVPQKEHTLLLMNPVLTGTQTWRVTVADSSRLNIPVNIKPGDTLSGHAEWVMGSQTFFSKMWK